MQFVMTAVIEFIRGKQKSYSGYRLQQQGQAT